MANHFSVRWIASLSICTALLTLVAVAFTKEMLDEPKVWPYAEMQWTKDQVLPSVQSVLLWGNPKTGEHGMLRRFPAGYAPPPHMHPSAERVVVVSGTIVVRHTGATAKSLGPGSYSEIPANVVHAATAENGMASATMSKPALLVCFINALLCGWTIGA